MGNKKGYWAGIKNPKYKHGYSHKLKAYQVWSDMMKRCHDHKRTIYKYYGKRGITVSDPWHIFENFYADMGNPPQGLSLERIKNNLGYSKNNCKWASKIDQMNNRRNNVRITYKGKNLTLAQWARETGLARGKIRSRLKSGWPVELIFSTENFKGQKHLKQEENNE